MALKYHPDKAEGDEEKFTKLQTAYSILVDPDPMRRYAEIFKPKTSSAATSAARASEHKNQQEINAAATRGDLDALQSD